MEIRGNWDGGCDSWGPVSEGFEVFYPREQTCCGALPLQRDVEDALEIA
jgi:hypothetical protein